MPDLWLVLARALHFAAAAQFAGVFIFERFVIMPDQGRMRRLPAVAWLSLALAVAAGAAWFVLTAASMAAETPAAAVHDGTLWLVIRDTRFGKLTLIRAGIAAAAALALARRGRRAADAAGLGCAVILLGSLAWAGHGAIGPSWGKDLHLVGDVLHLVAAGGWVGTLLPLVLLLRAAPRQRDRGGAIPTVRAVRRFSRLGYVAVATLVLSGLINSWFLVGSPAALGGTLYGRVLLAKLFLFLVMLGIAAANRLALAPRLQRRPDDRSVLAALRRNSSIELGLGLAVLVIVAVLGLLAPASAIGNG